MDPTANVGVQPPPPGVQANFVNPPSRAHEIIVANVACLVFSITFVALRFISKIFIVQKLGWDDWTCMIGMIGCIVFSVTTIELTYYGLGVHQWDVLLVVFLKGWLTWNILNEIFYSFALMMIKVAILLLYRQIWGVVNAVRHAIHLALFLSVGYGSASILGIIFACNPIKKLWDYTLPPDVGHCLNPEAFSLALACINITTDLFILMIPLPIIWGLQLRRGHKLQLMVVFTLGIFVCIVSVIRLSIITHGGTANDQPDATWARVPNIVWSIIEVNCALICSCCPALKPIIARLVPRLASQVGSRETKSSKRSWYGSSRGTKDSAGSKQENRSSDEGNTLRGTDEADGEAWLELGSHVNDPLEMGEQVKRDSSEANIYGIVKTVEFGHQRDST